jgi:hypothetical protein
MKHPQDFSLGDFSRLDLDDPSVNPFSDGSGTKMYGVGNVITNKKGTDRPHSPMKVVNSNVTVPFTNVAPPPVKEPVQLHHPAAESAMQSTTNMTLWLQRNHPDLLVQMAKECSHLNMKPLPANATLQVPGVPMNFVAPPVPMSVTIKARNSWKSF